MNINEIIILLIIGLAAGFVSGSMGVGGGVIIVPALVFFLGMNQHQAQGTSLGVLAFPVAIAGAYNYYKEGYINIKFVLITLAAFAIGAYLGSLISIHLSGKILKKTFGIFMLLIALRMILSK